MDEFDDWPISDDELAEIQSKQIEDPKIYNKNECKTRQASKENCFVCRRKCNRK
jgi:hypothetical protein